MSTPMEIDDPTGSNESVEASSSSLNKGGEKPRFEIKKARFPSSLPLNQLYLITLVF
jgi:hypothetical protein